MGPPTPSHAGRLHGGINGAPNRRGPRPDGHAAVDGRPAADTPRVHAGGRHSAHRRVPPRRTHVGAVTAQPPRPPCLPHQTRFRASRRGREPAPRALASRLKEAGVHADGIGKARHRGDGLAGHPWAQAGAGCGGGAPRHVTPPGSPAACRGGAATGAPSSAVDPKSSVGTGGPRELGRHGRGGVRHGTPEAPHPSITHVDVRPRGGRGGRGRVDGSGCCRRPWWPHRGGGSGGGRQRCQTVTTRHLGRGRRRQRRPATSHPRTCGGRRRIIRLHAHTTRTTDAHRVIAVVSADKVMATTITAAGIVRIVLLPGGAHGRDTR